jgi:GT2 family glycosyltransferase
VDNGSGEETAARLRQIAGEENVVVLPVNVGYAGGLNAGIRFAIANGAEYLWLLTKDLTVEENCLEELHALWPKLDRPAFLGSLTDLNGTEQVYFHQAKVDSKGRIRHGVKGRTISQIPELSAEFGETDYVNGACVFTSRAVIDRVGMIPEEYFLYFEDSDWGLRARRLGFRNYVSYRSRVHHHREPGTFNRTAEYYCRRNSYLFKKRNGFAGPLTKFAETLRLRKAILKALWRRDERMLEVLRAALSDVTNEKWGLGRWR